MQKSYSVSVSRVETSPKADYAARVSVAVCGVSAGVANEGSLTQREARLVSRIALFAGHRGEGWTDKRNCAPSSFRHRNQNLLGQSHRAIRGFLCHRALGQKARFEILDGDTSESRNHLTRPLERPIFSLSCNSQVDFSHRSFCFLPFVRAVLGAGQFALRPFQLLGGVLGLVAARQVKGSVGCGSNF